MVTPVGMVCEHPENLTEMPQLSDSDDDDDDDDDALLMEAARRKIVVAAPAVAAKKVVQKTVLPQKPKPEPPAPPAPTKRTRTSHSSSEDDDEEDDDDDDDDDDTSSEDDDDDDDESFDGRRKKQKSTTVDAAAVSGIPISTDSSAALERLRSALKNLPLMRLEPREEIERAIVACSGGDGKATENVAMHLVEAVRSLAHEPSDESNSPIEFGKLAQVVLSNFESTLPKLEQLKNETSSQARAAQETATKANALFITHVTMLEAMSCVLRMRDGAGALGT